tara:strand:+ start:1299 stop:3701 length:2403 start_codon:yes stop_codon:yes gene_type:complete
MALTQISTKGIKDGTITNADIGASAAIAGTKISPTFSSHIEIQNTSPKITFTDTDSNPDHRIQNSNGTLNFHDITNGVTRLQITTDGNVQIPNDAGKLQIGASQDLQLYHTGSANHIDCSVPTAIRSDVFQVSTLNGTHKYIDIPTDEQGVELYYDNSKKFETLTNGVRVTGQVDVNGGGISLEDNRSLLFGASDDLQIFHDGSNSRIHDGGTGVLAISGSEVHIQNAAQSENCAKFITDGAVELYHNNNKHFETATNGGIFRGTMWTAVDNCKIAFGSGDDLQIYHDGSNSYIAETGTGVLRISGSAGVYINKHDQTETMAAFLHDAAVELYFNNNKKFETTNIGTVTTGVLAVNDATSADAGNRISVGTSQDIRIYHIAGNDSYFRNYTGDTYLQGNNSGTVVNNIKFENSNGATELYFNSNKKFETTSAGVTVTGTCTATSFAGDGSSLTGITSQGKNLIINGGMRIHQRGTASYTINSGNTNEFIVDRFKVNGGDGTIVASQSTTVPSGQGFSNSIKLDCTVAESSPGSFGEGFIQYIPEGQDFYHLAYGTSGAKTITVSFWVKSSLAATYGFYYYIANAGPRAYQTTFTISSANTWEKKTITIPGDTAGNGFNNDASAGAEIRIYFYGGSSFQGSSNQNSWGTNASNRIPSGTNLVSSTSNDFFFTGFQIEVGSQATDYDFCSYAKELSYCQRYYWKIATNTYRRVNGYKRHDANSFWEVKCPVPMRTAPSPTLLTSGTFTNFQSNFNTTQTSPVVNEWNTDTGMGLLHVQSTWGDTHKTIPSWEGYSIEFSAEF